MFLVHDWICRKLVGLLGGGEGWGEWWLIIIVHHYVAITVKKKGGQDWKVGRGGGKIRIGFMTYTWK